MLNVVLVWKTGDSFDERYLTDMCARVDRYLTIPHRVICFTDSESHFANVEYRPFEKDYPGWWSKLEIFKPSNLFDGPVLYVDIDTVIVGNIDPLAEAVRVLKSDELIVLQDFNTGAISSALMGWKSGAESIYRRFVEYNRKKLDYWTDRSGVHLVMPERTFMGDQDFIGRAVYEIGLKTYFAQGIIPGIYSYKRDIRNKGGLIPEDATMIFFHGKPRRHEVNLGVEDGSR
jgi:hypothetical protein